MAIAHRLLAQESSIFTLTNGVFLLAILAVVVAYLIYKGKAGKK